jgi:hypothetical protein
MDRLLSCAEGTRRGRSPVFAGWDWPGQVNVCRRRPSRARGRPGAANQRSPAVHHVPYGQPNRQLDSRIGRDRTGSPYMACKRSGSGLWYQQLASNRASCSLVNHHHGFGVGAGYLRGHGKEGGNAMVLTGRAKSSHGRSRWFEPNHAHFEPVASVSREVCTRPRCAQGLRLGVPAWLFADCAACSVARRERGSAYRRRLADHRFLPSRK